MSVFETCKKILNDARAIDKNGMIHFNADSESQAVGLARLLAWLADGDAVTLKKTIAENEYISPTIELKNFSWDNATQSAAFTLTAPAGAIRPAAMKQTLSRLEALVADQLDANNIEIIQDGVKKSIFPLAGPNIKAMDTAVLIYDSYGLALGVELEELKRDIQTASSGIPGFTPFPLVMLSANLAQLIRSDLGTSQKR